MDIQKNFGWIYIRVRLAETAGTRFDYMTWKIQVTLKEVEL